MAEDAYKDKKGGESTRGAFFDPFLGSPGGVEKWPKTHGFWGRFLQLSFCGLIETPSVGISDKKALNYGPRSRVPEALRRKQYTIILYI